MRIFIAYVMIGIIETLVRAALYDGSFFQAITSSFRNSILANGDDPKAVPKKIYILGFLVSVISNVFIWPLDLILWII